ncbi:replication protein RepA [Shewanella sp. YIC-542]|uniref:replication protein RepA n=1 Tax=Shewanella mytili TaxID=3377111 RepID=UPI00398F1F84
MSLTDLKRKRKKPARQPVSVEDFIEEATRYAAGKPSRLQHLASSNKPSSRKFRHATFSLNETSIQKLEEVAQATGLAKSRLLRMFIRYYSELSEEEQQALLSQEQAPAKKPG